MIRVEHKEGKHQEKDSGSIKKLFRDKREIDSYTLKFDKSCQYYLPDGYLGWNKIGGTYDFWGWVFQGGWLHGKSPMHWNSHRLVWRYNWRLGKIEVAEYSYKKGSRSWEIIKSGEIEENLNIEEFERKYGCIATAYFGGIYSSPFYMSYTLR